MADNTVRRGMYLPQELEDWLVQHSSDTGIKVNNIVLNALNAHKDNGGSIAATEEFDKNVMTVIERFMEKYEADQK